MGFTRRSALEMTAVGGGGLLLSAAAPAWGQPAHHQRPHKRRIDQLPYRDREMGESGLPQIEHLVCVMMENHSLDNVLGMLPAVSPRHRWSFDGLPLDNHDKPIAWNPNQTGTAVYSYPLGDLCPYQGLSQDWDQSHLQYDNGRNDGFVVTTESNVPMSYLRPEQMPVTYALASRYAISDRYFCSLLSQTLPNRRYWFAATSSGYVNDDDESVFAAAANGTIFDRMDAAKVSWNVYAGSTPSPFYFPNVRDNPTQVARCTQLSGFFDAASAGTLPTVSYVEPNFNYESEENPQDIAYGEQFVAEIARACQNSPLWPKLALFITWDEHGGYYDHVAPPAAVEPDDVQPILGLSSSGTYPAAFNRYGFRVPFIVVSPWAQPDAYVSHRVADHTSVLAFIESWLNLAPMTARDAAAWNLRDMFDVSRPSFPDGIKLPSAPDITASLALCRADGENPPTSTV